MIALNHAGKSFVALTGCNPSLDKGVERVREEVNELDRAVFRASNTNSDAAMGLVAEEMADIILVLASTAAAWGIDLDAAVERKHSTNMRRTWGPHPQIQGSVQHVRQGP